MGGAEERREPLCRAVLAALGRAGGTLPVSLPSEVLPLLPAAPRPSPPTADWPRPEDARPSAMAYDASRRRLVTACHKPAAWAHAPVERDRRHDSRLVAALYNSTFSVVRGVAVES